MDLNELTDKIKQWGMARDLHSADPHKQILKIAEEFGELCESMAKNRLDLTIDGIGDMYVALVTLSTQLKLDFRNCVEIAYDEIKDRKGEMISGVFVKEDDL